MFFRRLFERLSPDDRAERWRQEHSHWLTDALSQPTRTYPRIPTARVNQERAVSTGELREEGGFRHLMATPTGRAWAERWWNDLFARVDGPGED